MAEMVEAGIDGMAGGMVVTAVAAAVVGTTVAEEAPEPDMVSDTRLLGRMLLRRE